MARLFFHLRDGIDHVLDPEGTEVPLDQVKKLAVANAYDVLAGDIREGKLNLKYRIEVEDDAGDVLCIVRFRDLVEIIGPDDPAN
jgi:hypothetical protein